MNSESFESLSKNELIKLLVQWGRSNDLLTTRLKQLEIENINQREEIRALKSQPSGYSVKRPLYAMEYPIPKKKSYQRISNEMDCSV